MAAGQWLLNAALSADPVSVSSFAAIALLVAAFVVAWNNSETFRNIVIGAWGGGIKRAARCRRMVPVVRVAHPQVVIDLIVRVLQVPVVPRCKSRTGSMQEGRADRRLVQRELPGKIGGFISGIAQVLRCRSGRRSNAIANLWNSTIEFKAPDWVPGIGEGLGGPGHSHVR